MSKVELTAIEATLGAALKAAPETDLMPVETIIELAELGRKHPDFENAMARIVQSPSSFALYKSVRESLPASGLRKVAEAWMEGLNSLPQWFGQMLEGLQSTPSPAYRAGAAPTISALNLLSPTPVSQSISAGIQNWQLADELAHLNIEIRGSSVDPGCALPPGEEVTVTVTCSTEAWTLDDETYYRFKVLSVDEEERANWARENSDASPRGAAAVLCSLGLFAEAERILEQMPEDPEFRAIATLIRSMCEARKMDAREFYL
jgi:hypothetical protein